MIPIANALMYTGLTVGALGILSGVILVYRALRDAWERRHDAGQQETYCSYPRCRESKYTFNRHRLTP